MNTGQRPGNKKDSFTTTVASVSLVPVFFRSLTDRPEAGK
jgi:hypothetical protein